MAVEKKGMFLRWVESRLTPEELERIRSIPTRQNEYGYDPFGFHRDDLKAVALLARFFYRDYFRAKAYNIENIPAGRCMLVANHSGQLPFDGLSIGASVIFDGKPPRLPRAMIEHYVPKLPYVSYLFSRWGQVVGTPDNCRRLLEDEEMILVFPEGSAGISKPFSSRYQLQRFGHGFMRLALATRTPIVPIALVGAEEQAPALNAKFIAKLIGAPAFPVVPWPPFFPILPLPTRHHIYFGQPRLFEGDPDDDDEQVEQLVRQVKLSIESMIMMGLKERKSIFF
ncbi:MAG: acyltransferase family protein [Deltaproteobacteria bacterium]|nr:acyltransferase family protein [Deltaproteobacteria bacterium]